MFATQILPETFSDDLKEDSHTVVGFIVFNGQKHEIKKGETKIGRDSSECSIAIENFTVSKVHAVIESEGIDETFIYDVGSTNQTRLGKKVLKPHCRYKLDNDSNITLGSIIVNFIVPPDIGSDVILDKSSKDNCNALDEYGDIFEMATQIILPQSNSAYRTPAFETKSKNFQAFKIPNAKTKGSPEPSESVFDLQTQGRLESQGCQILETTGISKSENHSTLHDYPEIFSLSTQCQEHESQVVKESRCKVTSIQEVDEFKSFLNDGQDDMLCAVLSLDSPKKLGNDDVEKTEITENDNLTQVLNATTQIQTSVTECQKERGAEVNASLQDKDFSTTSSYLQIGGGTSPSSRRKINDLANNDCAQLIEEDVIKTQEFRSTESQEKCQPDNLSQKEVTLTCLGGILTDNSMVQQKSYNEDFILTRSFEASLNKEPAIVIPESEDFSEDFMETQIYDIENEKRTVEQAAIKMRSRVSHDAITDITEEDKEDDFLATQVFKEPMEAQKTDVNYKKNVHCDDEDFIATQAFKETVEARRTDGNYEKNLPSDDDFVATQIFKEQVEAKLTNGNFENNVASEDEDLVATQAFKETVEARRTDGNYENNVASEDEDLVATQAFKETVEARRTDGNYENNVASEDEDLVATQAFKETVEARRTDGNYENNVASEDEDLAATQAFKAQVEAKSSDGNYEKNAVSNDEDFVPTQIVEPTEPTVPNSENSRIEKSSRESSPDLLALGGPCMDSEDCVATQTFKPLECHNSKIGFSGFSEKFISLFFSEFKRDDSSVVRTKTPEMIESSGDETESDLEILLEKHKSVGRDDKVLEDFQEIKSESFEIHKRAASSPSSDASDIHVFKMRSKNAKEEQSRRKQMSDSLDSDATDCEEIEILNPKIRVKHESAEPVEFEETQVLTLTPPNNFVEKTHDTWMTDGKSPKFENRNDDRSCSPLSLEMPVTQDMETSLKRQNEIPPSEKHEDFPSSSELQVIEVGIDDFWRIEPSENKIHSPKKRSRSCYDVEVVPCKKSKTEDGLLKSREKQFSKVVQTHDVARIQPYRTRNSNKNFKPEVKTQFPEDGNTNIVRPTSRRKINAKRGSAKVLNCDITPNRVRGRSSRGRQKKETAVIENKGPKIEGSTRVLRSSVRNSNSPNSFLKRPERRVSTRSGRRSLRTKKSEHFESPCFSVAFTGFDCPSFGGVITELGGKKVNDVLQCEVLVADKVRRTVKFLCAIGLGLPITSPEWLVSCKTEKKFLDPWNFLLKDEQAENKWYFDLRTSLERSRRGKLLQGFNIFATENTKPPVKELLAIVECCGGTPLFEPPKVWPRKTIIVSCLEDKNYWPAAKLRNVQVVHYEFILSGVLQQKVDFKTHKLR